MKQRSYSDIGIVLARRNFSEADRILSVYTSDHGRTSLLAKSIRKPSSRKRGSLEVFSKIRFQAVKTNSIDLITEVEMIDSYQEIRENLKKVSVAYFFMETVGRVTHEGEKHESAFELLVKYLEKLKNSNATKSLRLEFILELLTMLGFWPHGQENLDPDLLLEEVAERKFSSVRIGKKMLE